MTSEAMIDADLDRKMARGLVHRLYAAARAECGGTVEVSATLLEDAAAMLDSFQAGLVPVRPHPAMRLKLVPTSEVSQ